MTPDPAFVAMFDRLPEGGYGGNARGARWRITKKTMAAGRSQSFTAEELGGDGFVSFMLYRFEGGGAILKVAETPAEELHAFLTGLDID